MRVLEIEAIGPVPWAGMMLSDMGADVLRVDRPAPPDMGIDRDTRYEVTGRGRRSIVVDLKSREGVDKVLQLAGRADVLLEGMRPGVMERLGLGPDVCLARNPKLVYGRMTGWGQDGPLAQAVGHDINYIATAGVLHTIGRAGQPPVQPLNLVGDFGGGAMLLAFGVLAALHEAKSSGRGQVVDAAMIDGSLALMAPVIGRWQEGGWRDEREANLLDGGAHFYRTYATSDGKAVAVGAIEPRFYAALLKGLGLAGAELPAQQDRKAWPAMRERFAALFAQHTRDHWAQVFDGTEACVSPVLSLEEMARHPHVRGRASLVDVDGVLQPAAAPRFSRTPGAVAGPPVERGEGGEEAIADWV
nr:CaiB/BaiF CoA-transferase family protein [Ramlibacter albus]